jgi:hypothetical protein
VKSLELHYIQLNFILTEFTVVNNLVDMVTMEHNKKAQFSKAHLTSLEFNNFKMIEAMRLKIIASMSP